MHEETESGPIPKPILIGAGALVGFAMLAVLVGRTGGVGVTQMPEASPVRSVALHVEDRADGAILVREAGSDHLITTVEPGQDGFVRATLRAFAQARLREGLGRETPFRLTRYDDGTLALDDEATGRRVNLEAFGPTNAQAFVKLLGGEGATP